MTRDEHTLLRHLVLAVLLKLALLTALWWVFVRDAHVAVDAQSTASHLGGPAAPLSPSDGVTP
jgi:uncharacterized protein involved in cysteine biosynthesis